MLGSGSVFCHYDEIYLAVLTINIYQPKFKDHILPSVPIFAETGFGKQRYNSVSIACLNYRTVRVRSRNTSPPVPKIDHIP
jgi:hypothetical protein